MNETTHFPRDDAHAIKTWAELTPAEIDACLQKSMADVAAGKVLSQGQLDKKMKARFSKE